MAASGQIAVLSAVRVMAVSSRQSAVSKRVLTDG